jgi:hypothetical protein
MEYGGYTGSIHIGHSGDALLILEQILESARLDPDTKKALEAVKDALERGII